MIPKEKAEQLISEFEKELLKRQYRVNGIVLKVMSKQCALICVDNEYRAKLEEIEKVSEYIPCEIYSQQVIFIKKEWEEVKQEIEKS